MYSGYKPRNAQKMPILLDRALDRSEAVEHQFGLSHYLHLFLYFYLYVFIYWILIQLKKK